MSRDSTRRRRCRATKETVLWRRAPTDCAPADARRKAAADAVCVVHHRVHQHLHHGQQQVAGRPSNNKSRGVASRPPTGRYDSPIALSLSLSCSPSVVRRHNRYSLNAAAYDKSIHHVLLFLDFMRLYALLKRLSDTRSRLVSRRRLSWTDPQNGRDFHRIGRVKLV